MGPLVHLGSAALLQRTRQYHFQQLCKDSNCVDALPLGFHLRQADVHLERKNDGQDHPTGTGVAYVQFSSPDTAEDARSSRHKQSMGARYIECMTLVAGMLLHLLQFCTSDHHISRTLRTAAQSCLPGLHVSAVHSKHVGCPNVCDQLYLQQCAGYLESCHKCLCTWLELALTLQPAC